MFEYKISNMILSGFVFYRCCIHLGSKFLFKIKWRICFKFCILLVLLPPQILRDLFLSSIRVDSTETLNPSGSKASLTLVVLVESLIMSPHVPGQDVCL